MKYFLWLFKLEIPDEHLFLVFQLVIYLQLLKQGY